MHRLPLNVSHNAEFPMRGFAPIAGCMAAAFTRLRKARLPRAG